MSAWTGLIWPYFQVADPCEWNTLFSNSVVDIGQSYIGWVWTDIPWTKNPWARFATNRAVHKNKMPNMTIHVTMYVTGIGFPIPAENVWNHCDIHFRNSAVLHQIPNSLLPNTCASLCICCNQNTCSGLSLYTYLNANTCVCSERLRSGVFLLLLSLIYFFLSALTQRSGVKALS